MKEITILKFITSIAFVFCLTSCGNSSPTPSPTDTYNIVWKNYDGSTLQNETYNYGDMPSYKGVIPTKPEKEGHKYVFSSWMPNIEKVTCNKAYTALFNEAYTVSLTNYSATGGTASGSGTYAYGSSVTISASPNTGYSFEGWYEGSTCISTSTSYTFTMPNHDVSYEAKFNINKYRVSLTASPTTGGTVSGSGTYAYGSSVTISALPNERYSFEGWYEGSTCISTSTSYTFTISNHDISYEAKFNHNYIVSLTNFPITGGTVSGSGTYAYGSSVTIKATPNTGYSFEGWYKDNKKLSLPNPHTFNMPANDLSYEARFTGKPYTVTVTSEDISKGTVFGGGTYAYGSSVTIEATPKKGCSFEGWYKDGAKVSLPNPYTFNMPANDVNYEARFIVGSIPWYKKDNWWDYCSNGVAGEQATTVDIGREVDLTVNNQIHKVRLIGVDHDNLYYTSGKAHCTFEFSNLLSDSNGYSLATLWDTSNGGNSTNYDYKNSDLRYALDGKGDGTIRLRWYQKGAARDSTDYTKTVIKMLPSGLQSQLKEVKKQVATTSSYDVTNYDAKVFALTFREMTKRSTSYTKEEGTTYQYYEDHDNDSSRIKHQIKWHEDATTVSTTITDLTWHPDNYAGYNSSTDSFGGIYRLASPDSSESYYAWFASGDGGLKYSRVCGYACAVAPAFCI